MTIKQMMIQEEMEKEFFKIQKRLDAVFTMIKQQDKIYRTSKDNDEREGALYLKDQLLEVAHMLMNKQDRLFHSLPR